MYDRIDGNMMALQLHQQYEEEKEAMYQTFLDDNEDLIEDIQELIGVLKDRAKDYCGYDFSWWLDDDLKELL